MTRRERAGTPEGAAMAHACRVADAVLNEGHLLCPDRAAAPADRLRRPSGVLVPPGYTTTSEPSCSVTECLLQASCEARLQLRLRFYHLRTRTVERIDGGAFEPVPELTVDGRTYRTTEDVTERETEVALCLSDLLCTGEMTAAAPTGTSTVPAAGSGTAGRARPAGAPGRERTADRPGRRGAAAARGRAGAAREQAAGEQAGGPDAGASELPWAAGASGERTIMVGVPADRSVESIEDAAGRVVGRVVTEQLSLRAAIRVRAMRPCGPYGLTKLRVTVANTHCWADAAAPRGHALRRSLLATHLVIGVTGGSFLSPADPPEWAQEAATRCRCQHCWPVLAGPPGSKDVLLSAPIILYDHPTIGAEDRPRGRAGTDEPPRRRRAATGRTPAATGPDGTGPTGTEPIGSAQPAETTGATGAGPSGIVEPPVPTGSPGAAAAIGPTGPAWLTGANAATGPPGRSGRSGNGSGDEDHEGLRGRGAGTGEGMERG